MNDRIYRLDSANVTSVPTDGELVALQLRTSVYFGINESGRVLWDGLSNGATSEQLADALCDSCRIDRARAERDVAAFLGELEEAGLLAPD